MPTGLGVDFGTTSARAALHVDGEDREIPSRLFVAGQTANLVIARGAEWPTEPGQLPGGRWLRFETAKGLLGTAKPLRNAKGFGESAEPQVCEQLTALRQGIESYLQAGIAGAAIGVPACYGMNQRAALRASAQRAGFGEVLLLDESVAAAWATYPATDPTRNVLVYCLGRGLFAASVLSVGDGSPRALCHEGRVDLGAQDFDALIVQEIGLYLADRHGIDIRLDPPAVRQLMAQAELTRITLNTAQVAALETGPIRGASDHGASLRFSVRTRDVDRVIGPLVTETIDLAAKAIKGAGLTLEGISEVLLVGEATRTRLVVEDLGRAFGRPTRHAHHGAIASGASRYAVTLRDCVVPARTQPPPASGDIPSPTAPPAPPAPSPPPDEGPVVVQRPSPVAGDAGDAMLAALRRFRECERAGDLEGCMAAFEAIERHAREDMSYVCSKRASALRAEGRLDEATRLLEDGLDLWRGNEHIRELLADIYAAKALSAARERRLDRCRKLLKMALQLDPSNQTAQALAQELRDVQRPGRHGRGRFG